MKEKTGTDRALALAMPGLLVAFVITLVLVADQPHWLRSLHILFFVFAVYAVSVASQARAERRLDEVELAATRFGARWGLVAGVAFMIIFALSPFAQPLLAQIASAWAEGGNLTVEALMFALGVACTSFAQETFKSLFTAGWKLAKQ